MSQTSDLESLVLQSVNKDGSISNSREFASQNGVDHEKLVGVLNSLKLGAGMLELENKTESVFKLSKEGEKILSDKATPEVLVFNAIPSNGERIEQSKVKDIVGADVEKIGMGNAVKNKWIGTEKKEGEPIMVGDKVKKNITVLLYRQAESVTDAVYDIINNVSQGKQIPADAAKTLKTRKLAGEEQVKYFVVTKGPNFALERKQMQTDITSEMLANGSWKTDEFKPYNFQALGRRNEWNGYLHPLLKARSEFRKVFLEMGFSEMRTNQFAASSFWNFDSLFTPQQHPVRDAHDTFFLRNPATAHSLPTDGYLEEVKKVHAEGSHGSLGYRYDWNVEEAKKNILRTHTTAVSAKILRDVGIEYQKTGKFTPKKYFSIDRVFRNEVPDATHLCEFHQIEGMVIDRGLSLGDMIGLFSTFFERIGITELKYKPAFNPYTEPSMEIFGKHPQLNSWIEIGNSGMFRPEMLLPMGLPQDVVVLAWGLSLERPTMIKYKINNIRELVGHNVDIEMTRLYPMCRLDREDHHVLSDYRRKQEDKREEERRKREDKKLGKKLIVK
ncbi:phenylalanyl-tRS alpha subunit [Acrasis kona]|uniref:phenylalanine--tRNA ligase n=1 Tax=Acrasis kona TaxID=1008807 RepID=A0AAW2ZA93_9EUKA